MTFSREQIAKARARGTGLIGIVITHPDGKRAFEMACVARNQKDIEDAMEMAIEFTKRSQQTETGDA